MPRRPRIHFPGAYYHVTMRGNHRQNIFFCEAHRQWLNAIVEEALRRFTARVHAYCWMTNHIHLLVQVGDVPLGRVMLRIGSRYARRVQSHLSTTGHLFERRYDAVLVDSDEYLLELIRYIHLNPVRAKMVDSPDAYPWSSHHIYVGSMPAGWVTTAVALPMWHVDPAYSHQVYQRFIAEELVCSVPLKPFEQLNENDKRILGDDNFVAAVHGLAWRPRSRKTIDVVIDEVCAEYGVTRANLESRGASRVLARARAQVAKVCLEGRIASLKAVAARFGRDESTLRESVLRYFPGAN